MDTDEYKKIHRETVARHAKELQNIGREYALSKNSVEVGDIITDHFQTICVEKIGVYFCKPPECVYIGPLLTKKLTPRKNNSTGEVYQSNIKSISKK